jgi:hypothetical protein
MFAPDSFRRLPSLLGRCLVHRWTRYVLAWLVAAAVVYQTSSVSWHYFDDKTADTAMRRPDGNRGHTSIDWGGQWIMGRMLVLGRGRQLYDRDALREVLIDSYPREDESPSAETSDAADLIEACLGNDDKPVLVASLATPLAGRDPLQVASLAAGGLEKTWEPEAMAKAARPSLGGSIYPPVNALRMYPYALLSARTSYRLDQILQIALALLAAVGIGRISQGRIWTPVTLALLILYPSFFGSQLLGQNATITLALLVWGWVLISWGRDFWGGAVWGLLAFKPSWAVAYLLVLIWTRRWRACLGMVGVGVGLILLTLPFVGVHSWLDWFKVGQEAAATHRVDKNWIFMSRSLPGIPRRLLLDFTLPLSSRSNLTAEVVGWALLFLVMEATVRLAVFAGRAARNVRGPGAAFLLLGGWLVCPQFMYYDVLVSLLPMLLVLAGPESDWHTAHYLTHGKAFWQSQVVGPWRTVTSAARKTTLHVARSVLALFWLPAAPGYGAIANPLAVLFILALLVVEVPLRDIGPFLASAWERLGGVPSEDNPVRSFDSFLADLWACYGGVETDVNSHLHFKFSDLGPPLNTYILFFAWLWCAWLWTRVRRREAG